MKGVIEDLKGHNKNVKKNIFRSLTRIREEYLLGNKKSQDAGGKSQVAGIRPQADTKEGPSDTTPENKHGEIDKRKERKKRGV
jgi:hypothetical protein